MESTRKRKRAKSEADSAFDPEPCIQVGRLSEANLSAFNHLQATNSNSTLDSKSQIESDPEYMSNSATSESSRVSITKSDQLLKSCHIYQNRRKPQPDNLIDLCADLRKPREGPPTPSSKQIADHWDELSDLAEDDAVTALSNVLGYRGENEVFKASDDVCEQYIFRGRNHNFLPRSVPLPSEKSIQLETLVSNVGLPKTPRPDWTYGYSESAFTHDELVTLGSIDERLGVLVTRHEPYFPYWIVEWMALNNGGTMAAAELQARRDGAAAVAAMHNFFRMACEAEPSAAETAIFTACIDSNAVHIRVHWRYSGNGETGNSQLLTSYESDIIARGFLAEEGDMFRIRSILYAILEWTRSKRLPKIKKALADWAQRLEVTPSFAVPPPRPSTKKKSASGVRAEPDSAPAVTSDAQARLLSPSPSIISPSTSADRARKKQRQISPVEEISEI